MIYYVSKCFLTPLPDSLICVFQQKVKTDMYSSLSLFLDDVLLMLDNTRLFFTSHSTEHVQATALEAAFTEVLKEYGFGDTEYESDSDSMQSPTTLTMRIPTLHLHHATSSATAEPTASSSADSDHRVPNLKITLPSIRAGNKREVSGVKVAPSQPWLDDYLNSNDPIKMFLAAVYDYHDPVTGDYTSEPFHLLPSRAKYPEYYRVIVQPMDLLTVHKNTEVLIM